MLGSGAERLLSCYVEERFLSKLSGVGVGVVIPTLAWLVHAAVILSHTVSSKNDADLARVQARTSFS